MSDEDLIRLKERAAARLLAIPGVTAVGLGGRTRAGRPTGEIVLKVFVERKRPLSDLALDEVLSEAVEGLGVDIEEMAALRLDGALDEELQVDDPPEPPLAVGSSGTTDADTDMQRYKQLIGGANLLPDLPAAWFGTLGCFLTHTTDPTKVYALTDFHIFARLPTDQQPVPNVTRVGQPDTKESPTKCCSHLIGTYVGGGLDTDRDSAVVQLDGGTEWLADIIGIGAVQGSHVVTVDEAATQTYTVYKRGARTGLTGGTVIAVNARATTGEGVTRNNLTVVMPFPDKNPPSVPLSFAEGGDSGSAVVNVVGEVVGTHLGSASSGDVRKAYVLPITVILNQFQVHEQLPLAVATAQTPGHVNVVKGASRQVAELPPAGAPDLPAAFGRAAADLEDSAAGRRLLALWLDHHEELLALVNENRRVTIAWHRGGGPALMQTIARMVADPALPVPQTINGEPPLQRLERIYAAFHVAASPELRHALDRARADLPDPAGLTCPQILAALAAV